ncbi:hypothetical protein Vretifemale_5196 [Volvox reticuliferus]|uniref:ubiquitinyl hydrolase 1 n=1 Tax=Volvox reticuliferus TaxID=1737510 RepID=A0A8J4C7A8_9CHLO|nr:hypothetical protein Vretifemale_5196 [Volvox reticuliferus]
MSAYEAACRQAEEQLHQVAAQRALRAAQELELPEPSSPALMGGYTLPSGILPEPLVPRSEGAGLETARQRSSLNLGSLPLLPVGASFTTMLEWISSQKLSPAAGGSGGGHEGVVAQLLLRSIEREFFRRAVLGFDAALNQLGLAEVIALEKVVDLYRNVLNAFLKQQEAEQQKRQQRLGQKQQPPPPAVMRVELRSRELLVVWVAYCLVREAALRQHPLVSNYGVFGSHHDLRHLVLSDRTSVDAALSVAAYLQRNSVIGRQLFSLHDAGVSTMDMAEEYVKGCPRLLDIWSLEQQDAEARVAAHWAEVLRKQELARKLRPELDELESEGRRLDRELADARSLANMCQQTYRDDVKKVLQKVRNNERATKSKRNELEDAERAPAPVVQPLPRSSTLAQRWLFFLHMPPLLRHLSRFSFLAQQMLLPRPISPEVARAIGTAYYTNLTTYYNDQRHCRTFLRNERLQQSHDGQEGRVMFWSKSTVPDHKDIGPKKVDQCTSRSDGVWYPDVLETSMAWAGSGSLVDLGFPARFNPFAVLPNRSLTELYFTEQLPSENGDVAPLQWAMHVRASANDTPADRGNLAIARQDLKPGYFSKPAYVMFGSLRAYPLRQLRRLASALHDRTLPLDQPTVHVLVRQLMYHIGVLTDDSPPRLLWREGWKSEGDVLETLWRELSSLADELAEKRREHKAVLLLGEMVAYLADWHPPCSDVARQFATMTSTVADELSLEADAISNNDDAVAALLAKQCIWRCMALMCYGAGCLDASDVGAMLQLIVLIRHGRVFMQDLQLRAQVQPLVVRAHNVMASRSDVVMAEVTQHGELLTDAVARVLPGGLRPEPLAGGAMAWSRLPDSVASFEAVGRCVGAFDGGEQQGHLLSINILDGTVLLDGWPPNRLPKEVTGHPLYRRTFGEWNFQVAFAGEGQAGAMEGLRLINGRRYRFLLGSGGRLVISEVDPECRVQLELLDPGTDRQCGQWGATLPPRLREMHSHWLCRDRGVVVLRPICFLEHDIHFIVQCASMPTTFPCKALGGATAASWDLHSYDCHRVPHHLQSRHWTELLQPDLLPQLPDRLVLLSGSAVLDNLLTKFEDARFIHAFTSHTDPGLLRLELPRFSLEFELRSDGEVRSRDYSGYRLHHRQLLVSELSSGVVCYTLPEFRRYLVLERIPGTGAVQGNRRADVLVLVPAGSVVAAGQLPDVQVSDISDASLEAHCYEVHGRFRHLCASSIPARLQLAALYAATGTLLPEPLSHCTGGQTAMELLRQCWSDRPLSAEALCHLRSVDQLGGHLTPGLRLLARELEASAGQLRLLHEVTQGPGPAPIDAVTAQNPCTSIDGARVGNADAGISYFQERQKILQPGGWGPNPRGLLAASEERRALGVSVGRKPVPAWLRLGHYKRIEVPEPLPVDSGYVVEVEQQLSGLVVRPEADSRKTIPYPLMDLREWNVGGDESAAGSGAPAAAGDGDGAAAALTPLHLEMHRELADSWAEYHSAPDVEDYRLALGSATYIIDLAELLIRRTWDVSQHPQWLVFEVEGQLQIRPEQYTVARHLMLNPGSIAQLNMGEGKTRVILPMLALHLADGSQVVRLNLLSTLSEEAYGHLHNTLCAGVLGRKLFTLPFHRGVLLTDKTALGEEPKAVEVEAMLASLHHCKQEGGLLLVAPEHRLSMGLKRIELGALGVEKAAECAGLDRLAAMPYVDILDESDELLHHRLQLIYACGAHTDLPNLQERTAVMQALLHTASRLAAVPHLSRPLVPDGAAVLEPPTERSAGSFCGLRLLPGDVLEAHMHSLHQRLAQELMDKPPYDLRWLKEHNMRNRILRCVTDSSASAEDILGPGARGPEPHQLTDDQWAVVLALRGMLACNLLQHCLRKRHCVDFGINRTVNARKRIAVPYRAAHTPSERSEFAQPDVALLLTNLSYYYDGLSLNEFQAALNTLLGMGLSAQRDFYGSWLRLAGNDIPPADLVKFDEVDKVDISNRPQVELMHRYLSHNMAVVDFWLNYRVYPIEMRQYAQRLASSAWNLADNSRALVVGFSGTNDNHRLLPLQVHQADIPDSSLRATNGKMLSVILRHTLGFNTLVPEDCSRGGRPLWRVLLDTALRERMHALLDCGALLAGTSNRQASEYLRQQLAEQGAAASFQGVTYFDEDERSWTVCDLRGRRLSRHLSPIAERDTFVIYDDARCRGADLQLQLSAVGMLTLGPGSCKDKVMQAAGRLRQLGRGQQLRFAAAADVAAKIMQLPANAGLALRSHNRATEPAAVDVLRWVMRNTVEATQRGVVTWASQGLHFTATRGAPERELHDEVLRLDELYGGSKEAQLAGTLVTSRARHIEREGLRTDAARNLVTCIAVGAADLGSGHLVIAGAAAGDEECERELEEEEEQEQEVERQVPAVMAAPESDWKYATGLTANSVTDLDAAAVLTRLSDAVATLGPRSLSDISWSSAVWCTRNFLMAAASSHNTAELNQYLRPVGTLVLFASGEVLLVSEREADQLQGTSWNAEPRFGDGSGGAANPPLMLDLCYACQAVTGGSYDKPLLALPLAHGGGSSTEATAMMTRSLAWRRMGAAQLVSVQLFNGDSRYKSDAQRDRLRRMVWRRREDVEELMSMRGKMSLLPRSDLERACEDP